MNPITLTDAAISHIQKMLAKNPNAIGFRLSIKKTGCSGYSYVSNLIENENPNDLHFVAQNNLKIYLDKNALDFLEGVLVDFVEEKSETGLKQKRLVYVNPKEKGRCGCGESFNV